MKAADPIVGERVDGRPYYLRRGVGARRAVPVRELSRGARLRAALLGVAIAILAAAVCVAMALWLAQALFGTTGGIL